MLKLSFSPPLTDGSPQEAWLCSNFNFPLWSEKHLRGLLSAPLNCCLLLDVIGCYSLPVAAGGMYAISVSSKIYLVPSFAVEDTTVNDSDLDSFWSEQAQFLIWTSFKKWHFKVLKTQVFFFISGQPQLSMPHRGKEENNVVTFKIKSVTVEF